MALDASKIGTEVATDPETFTAERALAFAAIFADASADELDDARAGGFLACPFVCATDEWFCTHMMRQRLGLAETEGRRGVHAGQDTVFHRRIAPGARTVARSRIEDIRATRAGALMVSTTRVIDEASGEPYTTTRITAIFRGVPVASEATTEHERAPEPASAVAATSETVEMLIPRGFAHVYSACANIWNPIHTERKVALVAGLPDIIVHGSALWALAGRHLLLTYAGGDHRRLKRLACRFSAMVVPGTRVKLAHGPIAGDRTRIVFRLDNDAGQAALTNGIAEISA